MSEKLLKCDTDENLIYSEHGYCQYLLKCLIFDIPIIYNLYVYPEYRRTGKARQLLEYAIRRIRTSTDYDGDIGIEALPKENSIETKDLIKFYESLGLKVI